MTGFHATDSLESITSINPPVNVIRGTIEADNLYGTQDRDDIFGDDGDDAIYGFPGTDRLFGGNGDDALYADEGNDWMSGDGGQDRLFGGPGRNTMLGGADADWLSGGSGRDIVAGGAGNDHLKGDDGNDSLQGNAGRDTIYGGLGRDDLRGGAGNDVLRGGWGHDRIFGDAGNDKLFGDRGNDQLSGGGGNDVIYGDSGPDYTLQARFVVPLADPNYPFPREMILTDGETLVARNGLSEFLTYDVDTQHLIGRFTPRPKGARLMFRCRTSGFCSDHRRAASRRSTLWHGSTTPPAMFCATSPTPTRPIPTSGHGWPLRTIMPWSSRIEPPTCTTPAMAIWTIIPLPPSIYGWQWPPIDVELSGDTIAIHAGAYEGEEAYILNADTGAFVRQIEFPPSHDSALDSSRFRFFELAGDNIVFNEPLNARKQPGRYAVQLQGAGRRLERDTGQQIHVLQREAPDSLSPIYSRLVYNIAADDGEVAVADLYITGPNGPSISPVVSVLDTGTGEQIQRIDDMDTTGGPLGNLIGFAFSGGVARSSNTNQEAENQPKFPCSGGITRKTAAMISSGAVLETIACSAARTPPAFRRRRARPAER